MAVQGSNQHRRAGRAAPLAVLAMAAAVLLLTVATASFAHPKVTPEILKRFWPNAQSAVVREIELSEAQEAELVQLMGQPVPKEMDHTAYFSVTGKNNKPLGMLMNFDPPGFGMGVAVDRDHKKVVKAVIYKQQPGTPKLNTPAFLRQFTGKTAGDPFVVGRDIKAVKGAEKESQAVATAIKASLLLAQKGFPPGGGGATAATPQQQHGHH